MAGNQVALWLWNSITDEWEKAPAVVTTTRLVAEDTGIAGAHKLYWIKCNPGVANSVWALTDAIAAGGVIIIDSFHAGREGHTVNLSPPMNFLTGIWLETFTNMTSMTFGYV